MIGQLVENESDTDSLRARLAQVIVGVLLLVTFAVYVAAIILTISTARLPFLGAFVEPTMVVNAVGQDEWNGRSAGLDLPDRLVLLDGASLDRPQSLYNRLSDYEVGDSVTLTVEKPEGERRPVVVELQSYPVSALVGFFVFPFGIGLAYLLIGLVVFLARREKAAGRAFPTFCAAFALVFGTLFDLYTTHRLAQVFVMGIALIGGSLIHLALVFPRRSDLIKRWPWLSIGVYPLSVGVAVWPLVSTSDFASPWGYIPAWRLLYFYAAVGVILWVGTMMRRRIRTESPLVREQMRIILLGVLVGSLPIVSWLILATFKVGIDFQPAILFAPLIFLPLSVSYAILRYRLLDVDLLISRGVSYSVLTLVIISGYLLLVYLLGLLLGTSVEVGDPALIALFVFGITIALNPLRNRLQRSVERLFYRDRIDYRQELEAYVHDLGRLLGPADIFSALSKRVETAVHPERLIFFIYDETAAQFAPLAGTQGFLGGVRFLPEGGLAHLVIERQQTVYLLADQPLPDLLEREADQLRATQTSLFVPMPQQGWMALGEKRSGEPYTTDDLGYLEALGDQTSLALDRVQLIRDLERRVTELDALRWISQAINFSVGLDPLLELIYTQTSRVLGASNFYIALFDEAKNTLSYAFYVEGDERLYPTDEWPLEMAGLQSEIVTSRQPIVTDDYMSECLERGITPGAKADRAWMGVPLTTGDRVIGVMAVSSSEPGARYSPDQLILFSAVADQAAAIIHKARVDAEIEERARQLATLNQVASAINSTLDLQTVLHLITAKAAEILDAEAGSLFLTDLDTGEMVFEIAIGPPADDLVGRRLRPGTGIVGATVQAREPIIVNDAQRDERWFSGPDDSTGFMTRAILSVPLIHKDQSIGVLQILNKRDGSPFDEQDAQLMMAFASQAAAALENARLFTQTDQALAARVEELSTFQKIDQALNATLDYRQVIELTLDWAMTVTGVTVGAVWTLDEERGGLFIVASQGYPAEYEQYRERPWLVSEGIMGRAVRRGQPVLVDDVSTDPDYVMAMPETQAQLSVPLRLGDEVIGVINLESPNSGGFNQDDVQFATRLAERAVVPIENAQLYDQVKRANDTKSQFVSMVAHELKNPLTNIGGYARLLELGDGSMDDTQKSFIRTINSNASRMKKTVEDLLDISRIERGLLRLDLEEVSMATVIGETLDSLRTAIEDKGLELKLDIPEDLPLVWGDRTRLVQVLINLVDNARKYTVEGSIAITADVIELPALDDGRMGQYVRCSVTDTGIGISKEDQERLFKSQFVRFANAVDIAQGHGLGLWLINRLAQMQGSRILVESELGQGSTFSVVVPVADERVMSTASVA